MRLTTLTMTTVALMAITASANAGDFSFNLGIHEGGMYLGISNGDRPAIVPMPVAQPVRIGQPVATPVRVERVWVPPVYEERVKNVWVPTIETRYRDVPVRDTFGRLIEYRREAYTVESGHFEQVIERVLVREGHWQNVAQPHPTRAPVAQPRPAIHTGPALQPRTTVQASTLHTPRIDAALKIADTIARAAWKNLND